MSEDVDTLLPQLILGTASPEDIVRLQDRLRAQSYSRVELVRLARLHGLLIEQARRMYVPTTATTRHDDTEMAKQPILFASKVRLILVLAASIIAATLLTLGITMAMGYHEIQPRLIAGTATYERNGTSHLISDISPLRWNDRITTLNTTASVQLPYAVLIIESGTRLILSTANQVHLLSGTCHINTQRPFTVLHDNGTLIIDRGEAEIMVSLHECHVTLKSGSGAHDSKDGTKTSLIIHHTLHIPIPPQPIVNIEVPEPTPIIAAHS